MEVANDLDAVEIDRQIERRRQGLRHHFDRARLRDDRLPVAVADGQVAPEAVSAVVAQRDWKR
ncbi:MAG: hypothetical protein U0841_31765 [Chloroflexia bacterium]